MLKQTLRKFIVFIICHALAYSPLLSAAQVSFPSADLSAPEITQPNYKDTVIKGKDHVISVNVTDNVAVEKVILYYRVIGEDNFQTLQMRNVKNTDKYQVNIKSKNIKNKGIEYYIQAMDKAENTLLHGHSFSPLSVKVIADTQTKPDVIPTASKELAATESDSIFSNKWFWIGVGVLVLGAAAGGGGGGSTAVATTPSTGATLTITAAELSVN